MSKKNEILSVALDTIKMEAEAIKKIGELLGDDFVEIVESILKAKGRVVVTGIGKSSIIAQKMVATFNSTGTAAMFMHAADAIHGDLGMIQKDDIIICISKSGNTPEIKALSPLLKREGNILIAMTGNMESFLATQADYVLNAYVEREACPNNLAPTTSTTVQMVLGDALAVCLMHERNFKSEDFAKYHPGGALGKRLYLKVGDIIATNDVPQVSPNTDIKKVIMEITEKRLGVSAVVEGGKVVGVITDGDLRRMLNKYDDIKGLEAKDIMMKSPKTISSDMLAIDALDYMENHRITQLLVVDDGEYKGVIHFHNLVQEGII